MENNKTILYVDDDEDDVELLTDAFKDLDPKVKLDIAKNGLEALTYLQSGQKLPCLIVLDLNMPYLNGKQTFDKIKADSGLQHIPVIVFTSSSNPSDKAAFKNLGIDFITKPHNFSAISDAAVRMLSSC